MKRLALLCTLLLSSWAHAEDTACRRFQQQHAAQYSRIVCTGEATVLVQNKQQQHALTDMENRILIPFGHYDSIYFSDFSNPSGRVLLYTERRGKQGVIDGKGREILPPQYEDIGMPLAKHDPIVIAEDGRDGIRAGLTDQNGKILLPPRYGWIGRFSEGLAPYTADILEQDGKINPHLRFGYLDTQGNSVIAPQFFHARSFSHGTAWVKYTRNGAWLLIDRTGKILPNPSDSAR